MYKKRLALICLIVFSYVQAQDIVFTNFNKEFIPCEIEMNDGQVMYGFVKDFTLPRSVEFRSLGFDFSSIESKLVLDRKKFKFRTNLNDKNQDLSLEDIQSIILKDDDTTKYEKLKLKTINTKNQVVDLNREVMMPLLRADKINLYGLTAYNCFNGNNCEMMYVIAYIKNQNQEFAFIPMDFNRINLFNLGKIDDKFIKAFEEAGKDCPEFLSYLTEKKNDFDDKSFKKTYKENYKEFKKEKKAKLKLIKGSKNKKREEDKLDTEHFLQLYTDYIKEYTTRCSN